MAAPTPVLDAVEALLRVEGLALRMRPPAGPLVVGYGDLTLTGHEIGPATAERIRGAVRAMLLDRGVELRRQLATGRSP